MKSKEQKKEKKLKNKKELTSEEMQIIKKYKMNLLSCLICVIIFEIYLIVSNIAINSMLIQNFNTYINISYLMCILIAVIMFEISYKKDTVSISISILFLSLDGLYTHKLISLSYLYIHSRTSISSYSFSRLCIIDITLLNSSSEENSSK